MSQNTVPLLVRLYAEANESLLPGHTAPGLMQGVPAAPEQRVTWENWMRRRSTAGGFVTSRAYGRPSTCGPGMRHAAP